MHRLSDSGYWRVRRKQEAFLRLLHGAPLDFVGCDSLLQFLKDYAIILL